jgi:hypothetical protein
MESLRSLLELYGTLDHAVVQSPDHPKIAETVDQFLPGASANREWYREIEHFFFGDNARHTPNPAGALHRIATAHEEDKELTTPQKSRLFYGITASTALKGVAPTAFPGVSDNDFEDALVHGLAVVGPKNKSSKARIDHAKKKLKDFLDDAPNKFTGRQGFDDAGDRARGLDLLDEDVMKARLCLSAIVRVDGIESVVVDADLESKVVSLDELKAIVDPRNWARDYPDFFREMKPYGPLRPDKWGRILETVGFGVGELSRTLVTGLKYYKSARTNTEARLEFDLDNPTPGFGDGQVLVDRGFVNMWATGPKPDQPGVRIKTRKVVHIKDVRPYAQQRLVCITGYGTFAKEFLFGAAQKPPKDPDPVPWKAAVSARDTRSEQGADPQAPTSQVAQAAVNVWTDCVEDLTDKSFELSEKWMAGRLGFSDLADYSKDVSGRLVTAPLEFLHALSQPSYRGSESDEASQDGEA